jgi:hypothetical protein
MSEHMSQLALKVINLEARITELEIIISKMKMPEHTLLKRDDLIGYINTDTMEGAFIHKSLVYPVKTIVSNMRPYVHGKVAIECQEDQNGHKFETWVYKALNHNLPIDGITHIYKWGGHHWSKVKNKSFLLVIDDDGKTMSFTDLKEHFKKEGLFDLPIVDIKKVKAELKDPYKGTKDCRYGAECKKEDCKFIHAVNKNEE